MTIFGSARKDTPALGVEYSRVYLGKQADYMTSTAMGHSRRFRFFLLFYHSTSTTNILSRYKTTYLLVDKIIQSTFTFSSHLRSIIFTLGAFARIIVFYILEVSSARYGAR